MGWGGTRAGAGRKKAEIPKKIRGFRLTDDEWEFMKGALNKYRKGENVEAVASPTPSIPEQPREEFAIVYQGYSGAGLLAHLEELFIQEYGWLLEYEKCLKSDNYDKYTPDEIQLQCELIRLQIVTLVPHLNRFTFDYDVMRECSLKGKAHISVARGLDVSKDIEIKAWQEADGLDYQEENLRLARTYRDLRKQRDKVRELEKHVNDW